jgi:Flp pilus assembly protein TadG
MVEFALVLPLLLVVMFGLIEVGRLLFIYSVVFTSTREAARYGSASGILAGATLPVPGL